MQGFTAMKSVLAILALCIAVSSAVLSQEKTDATMISGLPQAFCAAWNRHDGQALAQIMSRDVDFVAVGALWLHGRADFEKYHVRLLSGRFHESTLRPLQTAVRFLKPDIAIVHWGWAITGDRNPDGTARQPRFGMFTMVTEKIGGHWLVVASQNDNALPWSAAEGPMPNLAMPIPGPHE
ncbi:MAG TPA: SgcJ/EcaC family oxidoreductase [Steroidobacteraceae bacterium]|jgi:uncharacterized protein (TIGR02246 family)|nr:SgcJ/EcaC family oxidoreductase [Steroidobacteraceae bacterium]